jgi:Uma2 family endonuclease
MAVMTMEQPVPTDGEAAREEDRQRAAVVRALHDQLDPPEGYRVEIIEGKIDVASTPFGKHAFILMRLRRMIEPSLPLEFGLFENTTLEEPQVDRYIPDLVAWPVALIDTETEWAFPGEECPLAVEVTSPDQERRDYAKALGYARSGVPVYLLIDRKRRICVVFTEPEGDQYRTRHEAPFGKPLILPLETPVTIDTSDF